MLKRPVELISGLQTASALRPAIYGWANEALLHKVLKYKYALPIMLLFPAAIGLTLLIIYPISYEFRLAFSNMSLKRFQSYYMVTEQSLVALKNQNVPENLLIKLRGIKNKEYPALEALTQDVDLLLGSSLAETYRETITKQAKTTTSIALPPEAWQQQHSDLPADLLTRLEPVMQKSYAGFCGCGE
ncbi:ABC-type sugar transport systems [Candidatus Vecturithrix granuli]|uniref:ABC-type sugar transport systems n=1 Tax=Vecturithrix granuli TaxID=1499967 RepID=A0A081BUH4_VECG1|nr:ABC-type sugar transport systems [Candidatus Vecturithrix granuli]